MYSVEILKLASEDVEEIYYWFEEQKFGLGDAFLESLGTRVSEIAKNPFQCEDKFREVRKAFTERFPYVLYYKIHPNNLVIIHAILHMSRHSIAWKSRVKQETLPQ